MLTSPQHCAPRSRHLNGLSCSSAPTWQVFLPGSQHLPGSGPGVGRQLPSGRLRTKASTYYPTVSEIKRASNPIPFSRLEQSSSLGAEEQGSPSWWAAPRHTRPAGRFPHRCVGPSLGGKGVTSAGAGLRKVLPAQGRAGDATQQRGKALAQGLPPSSWEPRPHSSWPQTPSLVHSQTPNLEQERNPTAPTVHPRPPTPTSTPTPTPALTPTSTPAGSLGLVAVVQRRRASGNGQLTQEDSVSPFAAKGSPVL